MVSYLKLFFIFMKIGAILLGGGYVILPIMQSEFVDKRKLIKQDDLINFYALSQSLPGIVAANITMFVGYRLRGILGAIVGMFGIVFVPFWTIVILASVLGIFVNNSYVQGALWGVGVAVIALILLTVREMWQKSDRNLFFYLIFLMALIALLIFKLSPIQVINLFSILGLSVKVIERRQK